MGRFPFFYVGVGGYRRPVKGFDNQTIWINPDTGLVEVPMAYESQIFDEPPIVVYQVEQINNNDFYTSNPYTIDIDIILPDVVGSNLDVLFEIPYADYGSHLINDISHITWPSTLWRLTIYFDGEEVKRWEQYTGQFTISNLSACNSVHVINWRNLKYYLGRYEPGEHTVRIEFYDSIADNVDLELHVVSYYIKIIAGYKTIAVKKP